MDSIDKHFSLHKPVENNTLHQIHPHFPVLRAVTVLLFPLFLVLSIGVIGYTLGIEADGKDIQKLQQSSR